MEIKKYALLDDKTIQECNEDKMHITSDNYLAMNSGMIIDKVLKTSDNILDLVEVGDLVGCYYEKKSSDGKTWVEMPIYYVNGISKTHYHLPVFSIEKDDKHIKAIYKKQTNGDYKKYEVEE